MSKNNAPSILIVEDNAPQQMVMRVLCEKFDFTAFFVSSGEEALEAMETCDTCYDAIIIDWKLTGMGGRQCTKLIRALEASKNRHTPIIAVTARTVAGDREKFIAADMDDYLSKPFTAEEFRKILLRWTYHSDRPNLKLLPPFYKNGAANGS